MLLRVMLDAAFGGETLDANPGEKTYQDFLGYSYANASDANESDMMQLMSSAFSNGDDLPPAHSDINSYRVLA